MTRSTGPAKAYTDSPALHPNLIAGSLHLLFWLFFHPSAWRNYVTRIDPALSPDFALTELPRETWQSPVLRRLLLQGYLVLPILTGLLVGLIPWWRVTNISAQGILLNILISVANGLAAGLAIGLTVSVAVSITFATLITLLTGLMPLKLMPMYGAIISALIGGDPAEMGGMIQGLLFGVTAGVSAGVAVSISNQHQNYRLLRQVTGFVVGVIISAVLLAAAYFVAQEAGPIGRGLGLVDGLTYGAAGGLLYGILYTLTVRARAHKWGRGIIVGLIGGLLGGAAYAVLVGVPEDRWIYQAALGVGGGLLFGGLFGLPYVLAERTAGTWAGAVAGGLVSGIAWAPLISFVFPYIPLMPTLPIALIIILLGLSRIWLQPLLLYPILTIWNFLLLRLDQRPPRQQRASFLRFHSAFWDEHQRLPLFELDEHLVLIAERNPGEGRAAIDYLSTKPYQHWAARTAQIELEARWLESCDNVEVISTIHRSLSAGELPGPASALLRSFSRISQDVLAALRQEGIYNQRLALRAVEERLDSLLRELTRSNDRYAIRFRPIADGWRHIVVDQRRSLVATAELRQEIDSPYIVGVPLTEHQEIFVGRTDISARIEQLLRDQRRMPLLLYGQRRMGKTSLLNNLGRLLPSTIVPLFVDLQGPPSQANDHAGFLYNLARGMISAAQRQRGLTLPPLKREVLALDPFTGFDEWLDEVEASLSDRSALLALDEFESLEGPIDEGRFSEPAVLGMFRHLIQHRPCFKVLLTGSHSVDEFQRWANYLINVQMIHIGYLEEAETRQLIERPVPNFVLRYEPEASQRVFDLTRGHPSLVQLLCSEIVIVKNEQDPSVRRLARLSDVETALPLALEHGSFFFADIERNQLDPAALAVLRFIAAQGERTIVQRDTLARQCPDNLDQALALLTRRELIESSNGGFHFQVELIRRWFARA